MKSMTLSTGYSVRWRWRAGRRRRRPSPAAPGEIDIRRWRDARPRAIRRAPGRSAGRRRDRPTTTARRARRGSAAVRSSSSMTSRSSGSPRRVASVTAAVSRRGVERGAGRDSSVAITFSSCRPSTYISGRRSASARFTRTPEASSSLRIPSTARLASSLMSCHRRLSADVSVNASRLRTMPAARAAFSWISRSSSFEAAPPVASISSVLPITPCSGLLSSCARPDTSWPTWASCSCSRIWIPSAAIRSRMARERRGATSARARRAAPRAPPR